MGYWAMTMTLSSKGHIALPITARRKLGLKSGATLSLHVRGNEMVLTPMTPQPSRSRFVRSKLTGLVVTQGPKGAPEVTSEQVRLLLADFP
jgi:bifunctional DNA-binding transcriptional regulator/antitoxin component of YhaV-PrlF toxin-antitoxin module